VTVRVDASTARANAVTAAVDAPTAGITASTAAVDAPTAGVNAMTAAVDASTAGASASTAAVDAVTAAARVVTAAVDALVLEVGSSSHNPLSAVRVASCFTPAPPATVPSAHDVSSMGAMLATYWLLGGFFAALILLDVAVARLPRALARLAFVRVGDEVRLPVPRATAALLPAAEDVSTNYREAPSRTLSLASFARGARVERGREVLQFVPQRNCIVATERGHGRDVSLVLVRIDVSWAEGGLLMRARYLPLDLVWLLFVAGWLSIMKGLAPGPWMVLVILVGSLIATLISRRSRARACFDAAVVEMRRLIAEADANPPSTTPLPSP